MTFVKNTKTHSISVCSFHHSVSSQYFLFAVQHILFRFTWGFFLLLLLFLFSFFKADRRSASLHEQDVL